LEGGYTDYLTQIKQLQANGTGQASKEKTQQKISREQAKAQKRAAEKRAREIAELENTIEATEAKLAQLAQDIEKASLAQDVTKIQNLGEEYQASSARLDELLTQWADMETA
jgi:ribosomal protein L7Ae-like RNA K-turn-binding protein